MAEWYIVEMLEKSWDGIEVHTIQGWNVGKPPYGYVAERHKHPVPAKRAEGKYKTKLGVDERRGPVVTTIYGWRVDEKLSYRAIAASYRFCDRSRAARAASHSDRVTLRPPAWR